MALDHSARSSLLDTDDYYYHPDDLSDSESQYSLAVDSHLDRPSHDDSPSAAHHHAAAAEQHTRWPVHNYGSKKQTSLARIPIPSFSAFRSQTSHIPVSSPLSSRASFSHAEKPSPRLVDPTSRPLSLDSPLPKQQSFAQSGALSPPLTEEYTTSERERAYYGHYHDRTDSIDSRLAGTDGPVANTYTQTPTLSFPPRHDSRHPPKNESSLSESDHMEGRRSDSSTRERHQPPGLTLQFDGIQRSLTSDSLDTPSKDARPKSPSRGLAGFFGWKSTSAKSGTDSPTTTFSERSASPLPSPNNDTRMGSQDGAMSASRLSPVGLEDNPESLLGTPRSNAHVQELEKELSNISAELASSIRREMDLEDELDRLKQEAPNLAPELSRRGSDYFSDSGASSARYPISDHGEKIDSLEVKLRKTEQEKAQVRMEMAERIQTELTLRKELEEQIHKLEEQLQKRAAMQEKTQGDVAGRIEALESDLGETQRRLKQERQAKNNFEDLYCATKLQLEQHKNETDNLRDEVVPQLKSQIDGLEAQAAESQALSYENTRLQQEIAALRGEPIPHGRIGTISEDARGLSRSNSTTRTPGRGQRAGSMSGATGPVTAEAMKEIEDQRDALHKALRLLISRHDKQRKDHQRALSKIKKAEDKAVALATPKTTAYHREVSFLKEEVSTLRKRTEDALEQKWEYEKGLSGLKMDLDRAESETRSLRDWIQQHDIIPRKLSSAGAEETKASEQMELSISSLERQRDQARQMAEQYKQKASGSNSKELMNSAARMTDLADQLDRNVKSNMQLRDRLADAVAKGEREQKESTRQIEEMQKRLAGVEDSVLAAQQHSETTLSNHEAEMRRIEEATSPALQRLTIAIPEPKKLSPVSPLAAKSPRLAQRLSDASLLEASKTHMLERKVRELEGLLREAEDDMQHVVQRVNKSQLEVADLQTERDAALTQMRKLQNLVVAEREKAESLIR